MNGAVRKVKEKGAALVTVLVAMLIISIMILEFQYAAIVERQLAYNDLNQLQAYYLAKAGIRVGLLRVVLYGRAQKEAGNVAKSFGNLNIKPFLEMIWNLPVPAFPPNRASLGKLLKADKDAAEKVLSQTQISDGQYSHVISNESAKINLNFLTLPKGSNDRPNFTPPGKNLAEYVGILLVTLLDNMLRDSEDPYEEYGDLRPEELVYDIMDWVNPGPVRLAGGSKDTFYEQQKPPYKAKRNRFYTLDELKLVRGMNDHLFNKLRPHVTVYSQDGKININSADSQVLKSLFRDFTDDDIQKINEEKMKRGGQWFTEKDFVTFVTSTLGRNGFTTQYPDENNYPFTVSSEAFVVESLGIIQKSKSQVSRSIRAGVALWAAGAGGAPNCIAETQDACGKRPPGTFFFHPTLRTCCANPNGQEECSTFPAATWNEGARVCSIPDSGGVLQISAPPGTGTAGAPKKRTPNGLKILYWTES